VCTSCYNWSMTTVKARFDGKVIIPEEPVRLPTDRAFEIQVPSDGAEEDRRGSPGALLRYLQTSPGVPQDVADEFMRNVEAGMRPADPKGIFDDLK
jgi:hypothetical protein